MVFYVEQKQPFVTLIYIFHRDYLVRFKWHFFFLNKVIRYLQKESRELPIKINEGSDNESRRINKVH